MDCLVTSCNYSSRSGMKKAYGHDTGAIYHGTGFGIYTLHTLIVDSVGHLRGNTVYPIKYAHGFVVLCFVVIILHQFSVDSTVQAKNFHAPSKNFSDGLYKYLYKFVKSSTRHLGLAIRHVWCVWCFSPTLFNINGIYLPLWLLYFISYQCIQYFYDSFTDTRQGCCTRALMWLPRCQWRNPAG